MHLKFLYLYSEFCIEVGLTDYCRVDLPAGIIWSTRRNGGQIGGEGYFYMNSSYRMMYISVSGFLRVLTQISVTLNGEMLEVIPLWRVSVSIMCCSQVQLNCSLCTWLANENRGCTRTRSSSIPWHLSPGDAPPIRIPRVLYVNTRFVDKFGRMGLPVDVALSMPSIS